MFIERDVPMPGDVGLRPITFPATTFTSAVDPSLHPTNKTSFAESYAKPCVATHG
jgi:hypothetical protein